MSERRGRLVDHVASPVPGRPAGRGRHAHPLADHLARAVEQGELDPAAADIDGKRAAFLGSLHGALSRPVQNEATITQAAAAAAIAAAAIMSAGADGCIAEQQAPSSGGAYFGNRKPMRLMAFAGMFVLALAVGLGVAAPSSAFRRAADRGSGQGAPRRRERLRSRPARPYGSRCIWKCGRAGMSIGATPAMPDCRPRSPGPCRPASPPARSPGRRPERFVVDDIGNYGYAGSVDLLVPIAADPKTSGPTPGGTAPIAGAGDVARLRRYLHSGRGGAGACPARRGRAFRPRPGTGERCSPLRARVCRFRPGSRRGCRVRRRI